MARNDKSDTNIQVFRGSKPKADVFLQNSGSGCCGTGLDYNYDKLAERTRFDNGLAHSNPTGANDKYRFPAGNGFADDKAAIIEHINKHGVGATISVLAIPTYAFVTGIGLHIAAEEEGLTFDLVTRNGLVIPQQGWIVTATADEDNPCGITRTLETVAADPGDPEAEPPVDPTPLEVEGFGALADGELFIDHFYRDGTGSFALEADEIMLRVASMPAGNAPVVGTFDIEVSVSYDVIHRAER